MTEAWIKGMEEYAEKWRDNKIGVKFGIFEIADVWFDREVERNMWKVRCTVCGEETTVDCRIGRDWMRGKGRSREKCKNCEKIKKDAQKAERQRIADEKRLEKEKAKAEKQAQRERESIHYNDTKYIGKKYGHLKIIEYDNGKWKCRCDCGFEKWIKPTMVIKGITKTCGRIECEYHVHIADQGTMVRQLGIQFEIDCEKFLKENGYTVKKTPTSGDYGVDLLVVGKDGSKCAFQLKNNHLSQKQVSPKAIMEIYAGGAYYDCNKTFVVSTTGYTPNAIKMANKLGVTLLNEKFTLYQDENILIIRGVAKSKWQWCDLYKTDLKTVQKKMELLDLTFEQALLSNEIINGEIYEINGEKHCLYYWCKLYNQLVPTITYRLKQGIDLKTALKMQGTKMGTDNFDSSIFT